MSRTRVAIVGAAGYAGAELTRLVLGHPDLDLVLVTSDADAGRRVDELYPALAGCDLAYVRHDARAVVASAEVAFLAVPHTAAMSLVPELLDAGVSVIDASADFRLADPEVYERWYGVAHAAPALLAEAVYGLPELDRTGLAGARLVACPGCYPTAALLAAVPAVAAGLASAERIVVDAKSGVSGAGRTPTPATHFPQANESVSAYGIPGHRHTPEIEQALSGVAGHPVTITFTPHLVPMTRGLLATVYLRAVGGPTADDAVASYRERFSGEPFVTVHPAGRMPSTGEVSGTNRAHIGVAVDERSGALVAVCAIDNLVKGTAGQAVQCANVMLGLDETAGLSGPMPVV